MIDLLRNKYTETWSIYNAFAMVIALILALTTKQLYILLIVFSISILSLIFINQRNLFQTKPFFGVANTITLVRFVIIILSFTYIDFNNTTLFFYSLCIAVALDFFDGMAARYFNESSFFG